MKANNQAIKLSWKEKFTPFAITKVIGIIGIFTVIIIAFGSFTTKFATPRYGNNLSFGFGVIMTWVVGLTFMGAMNVKVKTVGFYVNVGLMIASSIGAVTLLPTLILIISSLILLPYLCSVLLLKKARKLPHSWTRK